MSKLPTITELSALIRHVKQFISDDCIDHDSDSKVPYLMLTVGADLKGGWDYQTGDNSFMGGAYHYPYWGVVYVNRRANSRELARDIISQLKEYQTN